MNYLIINNYFNHAELSLLIVETSLEPTLTIGKIIIIIIIFYFFLSAH